VDVVLDVTVDVTVEVRVGSTPVDPFPYDGVPFTTVRA
jgi:hypothetical protein